MKRVQYDRYGGPEEMYIEEFNLPEPGPNEVRVDVRAAAINPFDWKLRRGAMKLFMNRSFPKGMGTDFAGIVEAVGRDVTNVLVGDEILGTVDAPSIPGASRPSSGDQTIRRSHVTLSWPLDNLGTSLPNLVATIAGNLFELKHFSGLRILDMRLPQPFAKACPGPRFSIEGTRRLAGVEGRPMYTIEEEL